MTEKFILKEGNHIFAAGGTAWNNASLDDEGARMYLRMDIGHLNRFESYPAHGDGTVDLGGDTAPKTEPADAASSGFLQTDDGGGIVPATAITTSAPDETIYEFKKKEQPSAGNDEGAGA